MTPSPSAARSQTILPGKLPEHPRVLAQLEDWERVKAQIHANPATARIYKSLQEKAAQFLDQPVLERVMEGRRLLAVSRDALERIATLAAVARLGGDERYSQGAIKEMLAIAAFADWNPSHYLDVAEMGVALAVGYDWLYDELTAEQRATCEEALIQKALKTSFEVTHWHDSTNNWNQVCHAGISIAAIAVADLEPELASQVLTRAIEKLPLSAVHYAPDGAYPEGPMYWDYGTAFHVLLINALLAATGSAHGTDAYPGFAQSAEYMQQQVTPSGDFYCYSDCRTTRNAMLPLLWFAAHYQRPDWAAHELGQLDKQLTRYDRAADSEHYRILPFALFWHRPVPAADEMVEPAIHWVAQGTVPVAMHRTAWGDPNALYLGIKGGSPHASHGHMDGGSYILEADGVRWALDLGMQDYHTLEDIGINLWNGPQGGTRWQVFRLGPESHNILRFNGEEQLVQGRGRITHFSGDAPHPHTVLDLTTLYANTASSVHRGAMMLENRAVLFQDEWCIAAGLQNASYVTWQFLTTAQVEIRGCELRLMQGAQSLTLRVLEPAGAEILVQDTQEMLQPYDAPNPGVVRIDIRTRTAPGASGTFRILAVPGSNSKVDALAAQPLADWSAPL